MVQKSLNIADNKKVVEELVSTLKDKVLDVKWSGSRRVYVKIAPHSHREFIKWVRDRFPNSSYLVSIDTVDFIDRGEFEVRYKMQVVQENIKLTLVFEMNVPRDYPKVRTITDIVPGAVLYERENYEMFGITFEGHPNLVKLFLPETWPEGVYPLRKDANVLRKKPKVW